MLSAARFFLEASFDCFFSTLVSLAKESSFASPRLDLDELEELEDELDDEVDEEDGVTPREEEEDEELELLEDEVLEIKLDELELDESSPSLDKLLRLFLCFSSFSWRSSCLCQIRVYGASCCPCRFYHFSSSFSFVC